MPRTLGPVVTQPEYEQQNSYDMEQDQEGSRQQNQSNIVQYQAQQAQQQAFYLKDKLPMFLAQAEEGHDISDRRQLNSSASLQSDINRCKSLIQSLCNGQIKTKQSLEQLSKFITETQTLSKGMGFFAAKNIVFIQYLMLLKLYELFRINGQSLTTGNGLELYKRIAYLKTLILKLGPVEKKLEYQKNKILKHSERAEVTREKREQNGEQQYNQGEDQEDAIKGQQDELSQQQNDKMDQQIQDQKKQQAQQEDEMSFKPRPMSLLKVKQQKDLKRSKDSKYQAPKVSSNLSKQEKIKQHIQRQKERRKIGLIRRLQSDLLEDNNIAQQKYLGDQINQRLKRNFQQKVSYEQQAFIRLPDNKKDKFYKKQMIRNSMRKNQLEQDYKEVQMVKELFNKQNNVENKMNSIRLNKDDKRSKQNKGENFKNNNKNKGIQKEESGKYQRKKKVIAKNKKNNK